jgi:hypothetical protein
MWSNLLNFWHDVLFIVLAAFSYIDDIRIDA